MPAEGHNTQFAAGPVRQGGGVAASLQSAEPFRTCSRPAARTEAASA